MAEIDFTVMKLGRWIEHFQRAVTQWEVTSEKGQVLDRPLADAAAIAAWELSVAIDTVPQVSKVFASLKDDLQREAGPDSKWMKWLNAIRTIVERNHPAEGYDPKAEAARGDLAKRILSTSKKVPSHGPRFNPEWWAREIKEDPVLWDSEPENCLVISAFYEESLRIIRHCQLCLEIADAELFLDHVRSTDAESLAEQYQGMYGCHLSVILDLAVAIKDRLIEPTSPLTMSERNGEDMASIETTLSTLPPPGMTKVETKKATKRQWKDDGPPDGWHKSDCIEGPLKHIVMILGKNADTLASNNGHAYWIWKVQGQGFRLYARSQRDFSKWNQIHLLHSPAKRGGKSRKKSTIVE